MPEGTWSAWRVGLLDVFRLERHGAALAQLYDRKQDLVLAYVALQPEHPHSRRQVAATLWPDRADHLARNRLSETLCLLKADLRAHGVAEDLIVANRHVIQLNPAVETDVQRFEQQVATALKADNAAVQAQLLEEAVGWYGRGLLPLLRQPWVAQERQRLSDLRRKVASHLAHLARAESALAGPAIGDLATPAAEGRDPSVYALPREPFHAPPSDVAAPTSQWEIGRSLEDLQRELSKRCLVLAETAAPHLDGPDRVRWLDELTVRHDDLRAALEWAIQRGENDKAVRLAGALWRFWYARGHVDEGRRFLEQALSLLPRGLTVAYATALNGAGALAMQAGELDAARDRFDRALPLWRELDVPEGLANTLGNLGIAAHMDEDYEAARNWLGQSVSIARTVGRQETLARLLSSAGLVEIGDGDYGQAETYLSEQLEITEALNDVTAAARALVDLATVAQHVDDSAAARAHVERALSHYRAAGDLRGISFCLCALGYQAYRDEDYDRARALHEQSLSLARTLGDMRAAGDSLRYLASISEAQGNLDAAADDYRQCLAMLQDARDSAGVRKTQEAGNRKLNRRP